MPEILTPDDKCIDAMEAMYSVFGIKNAFMKRRNAGYQGRSQWGGGDLIPPDPQFSEEGCCASRNYEKGLCCP